MYPIFLLNNSIFHGRLASKDYGKLSFEGIKIKDNKILDDIKLSLFQEDYEESIKLEEVSLQIFVDYFKNKNVFFDKDNFIQDLIDCANDSHIIFSPFNKETISQVSKEIFEK